MITQKLSVVWLSDSYLADFANEIFQQIDEWENPLIAIASKDENLQEAGQWKENDHYIYVSGDTEFWVNTVALALLDKGIPSINIYEKANLLVPFGKDDRCAMAATAIDFDKYLHSKENTKEPLGQTAAIKLAKLWLDSSWRGKSDRLIQIEIIRKRANINSFEWGKIVKSLAKTEEESETEEAIAQLQQWEKWENNKLDLSLFLPPTLANPLKNLSEKICFRQEALLLSLLTASSVNHHKRTKLILKSDRDFEVNPTFFAGIVAPSSQRKSPVVQALALKPFKKIEREMLDHYKQEKKNYDKELLRYSRLTPEQKEQEEEPIEPQLPILYATDATDEGIEAQVERQEHGFAIIADEIAQMFNGQNKYNKGTDGRQKMLTRYDGGSGKDLRASGVSRNNPDTLVSILGGIQPSILAKMQKDGEDSDGLWSRFCFVEQKLEKAIMSPGGDRIDITDKLAGLYKALQQIGEQTFHLSRDADILYCETYEQLESKRTTETNEAISSLWGKCQGRIGKIVLLLHCLWAVESGYQPSEEISAEMIKRAIALTAFFAHQSLLLRIRIHGDELDGKLATVLRLARVRKDLGVSPREVQQATKNSKSAMTNTEAKELMKTLASNGFGTLTEQGKTIRFIAN